MSLRAGAHTPPGPDPALWARVEGLIDRAPDLAALRAHRLHLLAFRRWRDLGRTLPSDAASMERFAALAYTTAPFLLRRAREAYAGRMALMKGLEVAQRYPVPVRRPFGDLDLIVDDVRAAQSALLAAGFEEVDEPEIYEDIHHLRPLALAPSPLVLELHHEPKWPERLGPPPTAARLLDAAVDSATGVPGLLALNPADHAVCLAAHAWAHEPLLRIGDLLDVALVAGESADDKLLRVAEEFGVGRMWKTTLQAADGLLGSGSATVPLRTWARHTARASERSVLENHVQKWMAPFWELAFPASLEAAVRALAADLRPAGGESRRSKLRRLLRALRDARLPRSEHDRAVGPDAEVGNRVLERIQRRRSADHSLSQPERES